MAVTVVELTDTFDSWRIKTNNVSSTLGDVDSLTTTANSNLVAAINEVSAVAANSATTGFAIALSIALG